MASGVRPYKKRNPPGKCKACGKKGICVKVRFTHANKTPYRECRYCMEVVYLPVKE